MLRAEQVPRMLPNALTMGQSSKALLAIAAIADEELD